MKKLLFATLSALSTFTFAQKPIEVIQAVRLMSKDTQPCFIIEIPQTTLKQTEKNWLAYVSEGSKSKAIVVNDETIQAGAINKNISPNPFIVYSKLLETSQGVRITAWLTENDTVFIPVQKGNDQDLAAQKYMRDFAISEYQLVVKNELQAAEGQQKLLEKELAALIKEEEKANKKVNENNRSIKKSNENIGSNNSEIENVAGKITAQQGMVERTASDANANKGAKQTLKDLQNSKKKLQNQNEAENKNIDAMNKSIREEERNIGALKEKQNLKAAAIEQQKQKVKDIQTKLDGIK